jgi:hypothetical protein
MKRFAAVLAVAGLMAAVPAGTAGAKTTAKTPRCGGEHYVPFTHVKFPLC